MKPNVYFQWIKGHTYQEVWDIQSSLHKQLVDRKLVKRDWPDEQKLVKDQQHQLIFCEHNHVYTLGKSGSMEHVLLSDEELQQKKIEFFRINRGGDITFHGPGQITGYPIFDLDEFFTDVHKYVRLIEEVMIRVLAEYGLEGMRLPKYTGVWLAPDHRSDKYRKICAIGVHLSRWVTMHGFAFNVNTDLGYFDHIVPCGIPEDDKTVTSLAAELGHEVPMAEAGRKISDMFAEIFDCKLIYK